ncbi:MAG: glycogen/starch synthase [Alphaproteobacteria bacterium]|nr:glycogen/starch synthase [Alphaproteobacteria bacterium]
MTTVIGANQGKNFQLLPTGFNKKKFSIVYGVPHNELLYQMQNAAKRQCMSNKLWPQIEAIEAWMISAETATFMKCGGLGMVASELPENFNQVFQKDNHKIHILAPMYLGDTGKKKAELVDGVYTGAEGKSMPVKKIKKMKVLFAGKQNKLKEFAVDIYTGELNGVTYYLLHNLHFFSINPSKNNPSAQGGCYVLNENEIDEVEKFAFFSKSVYCLLEELSEKPDKHINMPNILLANDWHSGALAGLTKYFTLAKVYAGRMSNDVAEKIKDIPIIHIAHHMGYQGWDYKNTSRILNSLYEDLATLVLKNAKAMKNSNPRTTNTLIVGDTYNQAAANMHLADRIVTVSKNYMEEVSSEKSFGFDFRDILKIRKNYRTFYGIVNGYEKRLISPNAKKINEINDYFKTTDFRFYDGNNLNVKLHNKKECIKLLSRLATDEAYKDKVIPLIDLYKFDNIADLVVNADTIPVICMTSRMVEQKGYDVAINAILKMIDKYKNSPDGFPIFILGGAGNKDLYSDLMTLKDTAKQIFRDFAKRIFVFRGYKDEFAYSVQLAADFYMMPSYFEPCGLTQMEAMAKGSLPIATSTGGLVDTIHDGVDGFRTEAFFAGGERVYGSNLMAQKLKNNLNAYEDVLAKALRYYYAAPEALMKMQQNAMADDFSWSSPNGSVYKYHKLFLTGAL